LGFFLAYPIPQHAVPHDSAGNARRQPALI